MCFTMSYLCQSVELSLVDTHSDKPGRQRSKNIRE